MRNNDFKMKSLFKEKKQMLVKRMLLVCAAGGLIVAGFGCGKPAIIGSDAGVYSWGRLYAVAGRDLTSVHGAALKAVKDLELAVTEEAKDVFSARVVAKGADGKRVTIVIKPRGENMTDLIIKVGVGPTGNKQRSQLIYERIRQNLAIGGK